MSKTVEIRFGHSIRYYDIRNITVDLKTSSEIAIKIMGENNIRHLPVVDDQNKLINFISHRDLISSVRDSTKLNIILITFICMIIPIVFLVKSFGWI